MDGNWVGSVVVVVAVAVAVAVWRGGGGVVLVGVGVRGVVVVVVVEIVVMAVLVWGVEGVGVWLGWRARKGSCVRPLLYTDGRVSALGFCGGVGGEVGEVWTAATRNGNAISRLREGEHSDQHPCRNR